MKKKKGFTLIELLAVIVILAIIALIATPLVLRFINKTKEGALNAIKTSMVESAKLYTMTNDGYFNMKSGEKEYIQLGQLENGYLEKVHNPYGEGSCDGYVKVENNNDKIEYTAYLDCGDGNTLLVDSAYVNYGGKYIDEFTNGIKTSDGGYIAVGYSNSPSYSNLTSKNPNAIENDGIIVKYNAEGIEEWSDNFGGIGHDSIVNVMEVEDGYIAIAEFATLNSNNQIVAGISMLKYNKQGEKIEDRILISSFGTASTGLLKQNDCFYLVGNARNVVNSDDNFIQYIIKYDTNFNEIWRKKHIGSNNTSSATDAIVNEKGNLVMVGSSTATNDAMENIKISPYRVQDAVIAEIDSETGNLIAISAYGGSLIDSFTNIVEVGDGYIVVGYGTSNDHDLQNLNKGGNDVYLVKYGKTPDQNGNFPIIWKQTFGGSKDDMSTSVVKTDSSVIVTVNSNSKDYDMENRIIDKNYQYAYLLEYDIQTGNLLSKKEIEGNNLDIINKIIKDQDGYTIFGSSFSTGGVFEPFNYGNSDAIMMKVDQNLNPIKDFQLKTAVKSKLKDLIKDYGTTIPTVEDRNNLKLYTTNDPTVDLGAWCTSEHIVDPNSNYNNIPCIKPFNNSDINTLVDEPIHESNNYFSLSPSNGTNWIRIEMYYGNYLLSHEFTNLKIQFEGTSMVTIKEAVELGYIEPLVISGLKAFGHHFFENSYNVLSGGSSGPSIFARIMILIKPKDQKIVNLSFESNTATTKTDGYCKIEEFRNFDVSKTKSE